MSSIGVYKVILTLTMASVVLYRVSLVLWAGYSIYVALCGYSRC